MRGQVQDDFLVVATSSVICFANATFPSRGRLSRVRCKYTNSNLSFKSVPQPAVDRLKRQVGSQKPALLLELGTERK